VRYADDFVIAVSGRTVLARKVMAEVRDLLERELMLSLNEKKSGIVKATGGFIFLNVLVRMPDPREKKVVLIKAGPHKGHKARVKAEVVLHAPVVALYERMALRGFAKKRRRGVYTGAGLGRMVNYDHADVLGYYNQVIRGLLNYYKFAGNVSRLIKVVRTLRESCALTLALKYKVRTQAKVFKKFGADLACPETQRKLYFPKGKGRYARKLTMEGKWGPDTRLLTPEVLLRRS